MVLCEYGAGMDPDQSTIDVIRISTRCVNAFVADLSYLRAVDVRRSRLAAEATAPGRLRRRVLQAVHGERIGSAPAGSDRCPWRTVAGIGLVAATLIAASAFVLGQSLATRTTWPSAAGGATTRAMLHRIGSHAELVVSGMPEPPSGKVYEVWLNRAGQPPRPTDALFSVTRAGDGNVDVPGPLRGVRGVTVTSEPLGGSSSPTGVPVLQLHLDG